MLFYKVKSEADNKARKDGSIYIANELYTENEALKYDINKNYCYIVNVSKKSTYWLFGARFAS